MKLEVILPAGEIPEGSVVHKVQGTKIYRLSKGIGIYTNIPGTGPRHVIPDPESLFMVPDMAEGMFVVQVSTGSKLVWVVDEEQFARWLAAREEGV